MCRLRLTALLCLLCIAPGAALAAPPDLAEGVIVKYKQGRVGLERARTKAQSAPMARAKLTHARRLFDDVHVYRASERRPRRDMEALAAEIAKDADVEYATPNTVMWPAFSPNDPMVGMQWHYFDYQAGLVAPYAWDIAAGAGVTVAVIDTGVLPHPDLAGNLLPGYDFITSLARANDGNGPDSDASDPGDWTAAGECGPSHLARSSSWHGTHVAGIVAAVAMNQTGVAGLAFDARILPVRVMGRCGGTIADIVAGMRWAAGLPVDGAPINPNPAKVLNLSLSGWGACSPAYQQAIHDIDATIVVAAGNDAQPASQFQPANCNGVITVGASDRARNLAGFSNYGDRVTLVAPGVDILSTANSGTSVPTSHTYRQYNGTSMAAPQVAATAAMMYSLVPHLNRQQIGSYLTRTARAMNSCSGGCGWGLLNPTTALQTLVDDYTFAKGDAGGETTAPNCAWNHAFTGHGVTVYGLQCGSGPSYLAYKRTDATGCTLQWYGTGNTVAFGLGSCTQYRIRRAPDIADSRGRFGNAQRTDCTWSTITGGVMGLACNGTTIAYKVTLGGGCAVSLNPAATDYRLYGAGSCTDYQILRP